MYKTVLKKTAESRKTTILAIFGTESSYKSLFRPAVETETDSCSWEVTILPVSELNYYMGMSGNNASSELSEEAIPINLA